MQHAANTFRVATTCGFILLAPLAAHAAVATPAGLSAGQGYRLAFVTAGTTSSVSSDASIYDSFATAEAARNSVLTGLTWSALVSTPTVNAKDNIDCPGCDDVPIYLVTGQRIANSTTALFGGSLLFPLYIDQFGNEVSNYVWTGSNSAGTQSSSEFGGPAGGEATEVGFSSLQSSTWIDTGFGISSGSSLPIYAVSSELFVQADPAAVPEPATLSLLGAGALLAYGARRRRA